MTHRPRARSLTPMCLAGRRRCGGWLTIAGLLFAACGSSSAPTSNPVDPDPERRGPLGRVAQFVVECELSHLAFDDPIVLPWQPGKSHLHSFFGNSAVDSDPAYNERILSADTSCDQRRDTASYWAPALLDAEGKVIEPIKMVAYYRPGQGVDPADVVAYPPGFMIIGGDSTSQKTQSTDIVAWSCGTGAARNDRPTQCAEGSTLRMIVVFPDCWDGERLTTFGASAHVRYSSADNEGGCPDAHPVALPQLTIGIDYPPVDPDGLSLASGDVTTAHADFWNVWDQDKLEGEVAMCINRDLVCGVTG
jgi:hypothetical protein